VERVLTHTDEYESLWRDAWNRIAVALKSFANGSSRVDEDSQAKLSIVMLAPEVFGPSGFKPAIHNPPFTAISHQSHGELFLIATPLDEGWAYRIDYPYYSWAETMVRPSSKRRDFNSLMTRLNELGKDGYAKCKLDCSELAVAAKFDTQNGAVGEPG